MRRRLAPLSVIGIVPLAVACSTSSTPTTTTASIARSTIATTETQKASSLCGQPTTSRTSKLIVIFEENEESSAVIGDSAAPNFNRYASSCGYASNYVALDHPSLPNYLETTSGVSYGLAPYSSDCEASQNGCTTTNTSIFSQMSNWKGYAESMPANCDPSNASTSTGEYYVRHNPEPYFTNVSGRCQTNDVPMGTTTRGALSEDVRAGVLPTFATVTPNGTNDGHDTDVATADRWIGPVMTMLTSGSDYRSGKLTIEIVWDEGSGSDQTVASIWLSEHIVPGSRTAVAMNNYSTLRAADEVAGLPLLGGATSAGDPRVLGF